MTKLAYSLGRTINTGNFNSARVDVSHEIECEPHEVEEKYEQLRSFVKKKLKEAIEELR